MKNLALLLLLFFLSGEIYSQTNCVGSVGMTLSPAQPPGGYTPGTTVDICVSVTGYIQMGATWLHGVGISFGPGWDINSVNPYSPAPSCDGQGNWGWYNSCTSSASGLLFGPGFYYDNPAGSTSGALDGIPGNNFGDNCQSYTWNFCLTIQTNSNVTGIIPLTGHVTITSDGITGSWGNNGCNTEYHSFNALLGTNPCAASFSYAAIPVENVPMAFMNSSSGINPVYSWTFGDGATSSLENPIHTYQFGGNYTVCLAINDTTTGCTDNICTTINVYSNYWNGSYPFHIGGTVFYDADSNGVKDLYEAGLNNQQLSLQPVNLTVNSLNSGDYNFPVNAGDYIVQVAPPTGWTLTTDSLLFHVHVDSVTGSVSGFDFGFIPDQLSVGIEVDFYEGVSNCNSDAQQLLEVKNTGTEFISGVMSYVKHDSITIISYNVIPDSIIQNTYYWHYTHIAPFHQEQIVMLVDKPNTPAFTVDYIVNADIRDSLNNIIASDSAITFEIITCSYDPNSKYVEPVNEIMGQNYTLIGNTLNFTITFQNTGNAPAENVVIVDTLAALLDLSTFNLIMSSHAVSVHMTQGGIITFLFNGINLPDSVNNEPESHGFVQFSIETITPIQNNTLIENTAHIFFDQNPPVSTGTAATMMVLNFPSGHSENINNTGISIYPNPTHGVINIMSTTSFTGSDYLIIFDAAGKLIMNQKLNNLKTIDLSNYASGIYTIKFVEEKNISIFKITVQ